MDFKFEFKRHQRNKIPREKIISELERVAEIFKYTDFKQDDFDQISHISSYTVYREFGSWEKTMQILADSLRSKSIEFKITTRRSSYSMQEIFDEMERIWVQLGHRPSRDEWVTMKPKMSYDTIYRHFGGWTNACLKFIEYKSGGKIDDRELEEPIGSKNQLGFLPTNNEINTTKKIEKTRIIPLSVRIKVLARDNFRCVFCGKSPATDIGVKLHIDHIIPFSNDGKSSLDNLQTLCEECNLGKSNKKIMRQENIAQSSISRGGDGGQIMLIGEHLTGKGQISVDGGDGEIGGNAGKIHVQIRDNQFEGKISGKGGKSRKQ